MAEEKNEGKLTAQQQEVARNFLNKLRSHAISLHHPSAVRDGIVYYFEKQNEAQDINDVFTKAALPGSKPIIFDKVTPTGSRQKKNAWNHLNDYRIQTSTEQTMRLRQCLVNYKVNEQLIYHPHINNILEMILILENELQNPFSPDKAVKIQKINGLKLLLDEIHTRTSVRSLSTATNEEFASFLTAVRGAVTFVREQYDQLDAGKTKSRTSKLLDGILKYVDEKENQLAVKQGSQEESAADRTPTPPLST